MKVRCNAFCPDCGGPLTVSFNPETCFESVGCDACAWEEMDSGLHFSVADLVRDVEA